MEACKNKDVDAEELCSSLLLAVGDALYVIGGKWKLRVIIGLTGKKKRFNELQKTIPGISAKVLSAELKELESNGFVIREIHTATMPVIVEYQLTDYAMTLKDVVGSLKNWGTMHRETIKNKRPLS
jgi:DNA-binding HxlR family transcriptional regulator